jgi:hypothetical protein
MSDPQSRDPLAGVSPHEQATMAHLLRMRPEQHKTAVKVESPKGEAQRRRREKERQRPTEASGGG